MPCELLALPIWTQVRYELLALVSCKFIYCMEIQLNELDFDGVELKGG